MNKKENIAQLKKFLEMQAEIWAAERKMLNKSEKLSIAVYVTGGRIRRANILREILIENDWKIINGLTWNETRQRIINLFQKTGGGPLSMEEISQKLELVTTDGSYIAGINSIFRRECLPYRIMTFGKWGQYYPKKPQKLVVTSREQ